MARGTLSSLPVGTGATDVSKMGPVGTAGVRTAMEAVGAATTGRAETGSATIIRTRRTPTASATPSVGNGRSRRPSSSCLSNDSSLSNSSSPNDSNRPLNSSCLSSNSNLGDRRRSSRAAVGGAGGVGPGTGLTATTEDSSIMDIQRPLVHRSSSSDPLTGMQM
ncbi:unnamed protein product [Ectocarpus sp. CCAP 1310/34]|nr:unnamed protein product [Ectocarpus sp. CCAP 1310/34]